METVHETDLGKYIADKGVKLSFIAEELGISRDSLRNKLNNKFEFKSSEIRGISLMLGLTPEQTIYFFNLNGDRE